jgi:hypothetical protein
MGMLDTLGSSDCLSQNRGTFSNGDEFEMKPQEEPPKKRYKDVLITFIVIPLRTEPGFSVEFTLLKLTGGETVPNVYSVGRFESEDAGIEAAFQCARKVIDGNIGLPPFLC